MEEGGEVDGTLKCSNKSSRKARNEAVGDTDAVDVAAAETTGKEDESPSPPSPSPQWRQRKKIDVERGGMAVAPTRSTPFAEAVPPEKTARSRPPGLAPLAPAMGSSGGGLSKTLPAAVVWPPSTPSAAAAGVSSPRQDLGRGGAKYMGPVKRVAPRRGLSLPAGSPSRIAHVSAPSPKRPPGLQVRAGVAMVDGRIGRCTELFLWLSGGRSRCGSHFVGQDWLVLPHYLSLISGGFWVWLSMLGIYFYAFFVV